MISILLLLFPYALSRGGTALCPERNAARLNILIPTLLPFMILTGILIRTDLISQILLPLEPFLSKIFGISPGRCLCSSLRTSLRLSHGSKSHFRSLYRSEDQPPGSAVSPYLYQPCQSCIHQFLSDTYLYERAVPRFQDLWNSAGFRMAHDDCYASGVLQGKYSVGNIRHKKRDILLRLSRSRTGCLYYERF